MGSEMCIRDRLNNLIRQATPSEQIELIQVVEQLALLQPEATLQVSNL